MPIPFLPALKERITSPRAEKVWAIRLRLETGNDSETGSGRLLVDVNGHTWCELVRGPLGTRGIVTG
jgi:hypothetical protein